MRINRFVAMATGMSRRAADKLIEAGQVSVNGAPASAGTQVSETDAVSLNGQAITLPQTTTTIIFNKPVGYVCSRNGQGGKTIYELLPAELQQLKTIGRLDKNSSGLLLLTNDGELAHQLTHPSFHKTKIYEVTLNKPLAPLHRQMIAEIGVQLDDGPSRFAIERLHDGNDKAWRVTMHEGRNRQIRRTFASLGYEVAGLHRTQFGAYLLQGLAAGKFRAAE